MPVSYNSKYIVPAPYLNVQKSYVRTESQAKTAPSYKLMLTGKLLPQKGSPDSSGAFSTTSTPADQIITDNFDALLNKREALEKLFADDGKPLVVSSCQDTLLSCYPTIDNVQFSEGHWYQYIDYSVDMSTPFVSGTLFGDPETNEYLSSARETWNLESTDEYQGIEGGNVYNLTHSLNAVGIDRYGNDGLVNVGWKEARSWVYPRLGLDTTYIIGTSGIGLPSYYTGYNYKRTEETDENGGSYSVNETWTITSGNTIEEFSVDVRIPTETYLVSVTAQGNIRGLESGTPFFAVPTARYDNAVAKFGSLTSPNEYNTIYNRAREYSGYSNLNPNPISRTIAKNPVQGFINYTYEYDTRPTTYVSGALWESIQIQDTYANQLYGQVVVLGRANGPVLQDMGTVTAPKKSITVDVIMPYYSGASLAYSTGYTALYAASPKLQVDPIVDAFYTYLSGTYDQVFCDGDTDNWDIKTGKYNRQKSWTIGDCS